MIIGVLALQGNFTMHQNMLSKLDVPSILVKYPHELNECDGLIIPGFHMNKVHWNTVALEMSIPHQLIIELIDHSYDLIVLKLTKKLKLELENL